MKETQTESFYGALQVSSEHKSFCRSCLPVDNNSRRTSLQEDKMFICFLNKFQGFAKQNNPLKPIHLSNYSCYANVNCTYLYLLIVSTVTTLKFGMAVAAWFSLE